MMKDKKFYTIGEVAKKIGIHDQTIRMYEQKNLICPKRTENNYRIFSKQDIIRITIIITLTQEIGMNIVGVKMIFALAKHQKISDEFLLDFIYDLKHEFSG